MGTGKIHENFQYLFYEIRGQFRNFPPRRRGPGRGLGGLYSIECPRIGGKKTISLKRFFLADKGSRGTSSKSDLRAPFRVRPVDKSVKGGNYDKKKVLLHRLPPSATTKKKSFHKYIPLFGVLLNILPCFKRLD